MFCLDERGAAGFVIVRNSGMVAIIFVVDWESYSRASTTSLNAAAGAVTGCCSVPPNACLRVVLSDMMVVWSPPAYFQ